MNCVFCEEKVQTQWSLGTLPPSDTFCHSQLKAYNAYCQELAIGICNSCGLVQNTNVISEHIRYEETEYSYNSANSNYAKLHWENYVKYLGYLINPETKCRVLEIGANDGYCAALLKNKNPSIQVCAVDASSYQTNKAKENYKDITFKQCVFGVQEDDFSKNSFDLIYANNVLNHSNKLNNFIDRVFKLLKIDGLFIFEVPLLDMMFLNYKWDQIYHEHVSYFSINSLMTILSSGGFNINNIEINDYHGGSARVTCKKEKNIFVNNNVSYIDSTKRNITILKNFAEKQKILLRSKIKEINKLNNSRIYFFGAPAKGVTLINYCELNTNHVVGCLENSEDKIGKFIPKSGIPIINEDDVIAGSYLINLLWNIPDLYKKIIKQKQLIGVQI